MAISKVNNKVQPHVHNEYGNTSSTGVSSQIGVFINTNSITSYPNFIYGPSGSITANQFVSNTNFKVSNETGSVIIDAINGIRLSGTTTTYEDLRFPAITSKLGGSKDPAFVRFKNNAGSQGVFTYSFHQSIEQELYFIAQMPHSWKENSDLYMHVHWSPTTSSTGNVVWGIEYTWSNIHDVYPNTTIVTASLSSSTVSGMHQIGSIATISGTGKNLSSMLICRIFRDATNGADTYPDSAFLIETDIHYQIDSFGSNDEFEKD